MCPDTCTIPNNSDPLSAPLSTSITYTIGNADNGCIGINFFDDSKTMCIGSVTSDFVKPDISTQKTLTPNSPVSSEALPNITHNKLGVQILGVDYGNAPDSGIGSITTTGIISCPSGKYRMNLTVAWELKEITT